MAWLLAAPTAASTQAPALVDRSRPCQGCSIALEREVTLRDSPVAPFGANVTAIARDGAGRIFVPSRAVPGEVYVFEASGEYLSTIGRRGEGPGEYRAVTHISVGPGDTVRLFDNALARMTVLTSSLAVARTSRMPVAIRATEAVMTAGGMIVAAGQSGARDEARPALHVIDQEGRLLRSFGREEATSYIEAPFATSRALALDGLGRLWAARRTSYELALWDLAGTKQLELNGGAEWFRPWLTDAPLAPDAPPLPWIQAIQVDGHGRVWVLCLVAAADFADGLTREESPGGPRYRLSDYARVFDTVVEVIDPMAKRLIVSTRVDAYLTNFVSEGTVLGVRDDASGIPLLDLWRMRLQTPQDGR